MNIQYSFHNLSDAEKRSFQELVEQKRAHFEKLVSVSANAKLQFRVEKFEKHSVWHVSANCDWDSGHVFTEEKKHTAHEALEKVLCELERQMQKMKAKNIPGKHFRELRRSMKERFFNGESGE